MKDKVIIAFTRNGINLALRLANFLDCEIFAPERFCEPLSNKIFHEALTFEKMNEHLIGKIFNNAEIKNNPLSEHLTGKILHNSEGFRLEKFNINPINEPLSVWAGKIFHEVKALIFVGACGIAVRAIAPHVKSKLSDPAVIVIDEAGKFVIPVLSGHIGGANELAREIAGKIQAQAIITTATDINNINAVDEWAVKNNCVIENPEAIKKVSSFILDEYAANDKNKISLNEFNAHPIGVAVTCENISVPFPVTLMLRPKNLILGAGCNRGVDVSEFECSAKDFLDGAGVSILSLKALASIDIKKDEPALINFAEKYNIPFITFTASELRNLPGNFTSSQRVLEAVGVDNVCERACVLAGGEGAVLLRSKFVYNGITFALARSVENDIKS